MKLKEVKGTDLKLADIIRLDTEAFGDAIVENIDGTEITLTRPYMHHSDFSHTGGVITYIGVEKFTVSTSGTFNLVRRGPALK